MVEGNPTEEFGRGEFSGIDAYPDMLLRREMSDYAETRVDFNLEGMLAAKRHLELSADDIVLDVGTSSGLFALRAAQEAQIPARIIGLDIIDYAHADYARVGVDASNFSFIHANGENIPLVDSSVSVTTAHNVLFRSQDVLRMLAELKRVTKAGGLIICSTNSKDHAGLRHQIENQAARRTNLSLGRKADPIRPPAEGFYLEDVPRLTEQSGGLEIVEAPDPDDRDGKNPQDSVARIYIGSRLETFRLSIDFSANYTDLPAEVYRVFRAHVEDIINRYSKKIFDLQRRDQLMTGKKSEPHLIDHVRRGMFVLRNVK